MSSSTPSGQPNYHQDPSGSRSHPVDGLHGSGQPEHWQERAASFQKIGSDYEKYRPDQPDEVTAWMIGQAHGVLDLGAGTGKITDSLIRLGRTVTAVDPSASMMAELAAKHPQVPCLAGTGEDIPLLDHSIDAVVVGSAWHWMDAERTGAELARVLRPGGMLGLCWNGPDRSLGWVRALYSNPDGRPGGLQIISRTHRPGHPSHGFGPLQQRKFTYSREMTREEFHAEQATHSSWILADEPTRARWTALVNQRLDHDPHTTGREVFEIPQQVIAYRAELATTTR